ncbi:MAG: hypothetical protein M1828_000272 [Chrysothrix sp. TS-e1954]|nr:MAG: hypothetical protein M1828_000272 [Chrysothrix sp. TS-e1954]
MAFSASGAFTPIASEPAIIAAGGGSLYPTLVPKKRSNRSPLADMREATVEERSTGKSLDSSKKAETCPKGTAQCPKGQSEKEVDCVKTVEIITTLTSTKTASRTTTVPASTKTVTVTKSFTATQTVANPDASTTVTSSASTTITVTATSTTSTIVTTDTTTTTTAVATAYAACQPDNMISYVNNNGISSFTPDNDGKYGNADSAYDCCVQCENALQCAGFQFYPPTGFCALYNSANQGTSCDASVASWGFYTSTGTVNVPVVGNGECGQATYHGN